MRIIALFYIDNIILSCTQQINHVTYRHCASIMDLTHILAFRDNQEKLNHKVIRQDIFIIIVLLTCIGNKNKRCTKIKGQGHSQ